MGTRNRFSIGRPCCSPPPPCNSCSVDPGDNIPVTFFGFNNSGLCSCGTFFNKTFVLTRMWNYACAWQTYGVMACSNYGYFTTGYTITAWVANNAFGRKAWFCQLYVGGGVVAEWTWDSGGSSLIDCTVQRTLSFYYGYLTGVCGGYATSICQVN